MFLQLSWLPLQIRKQAIKDLPSFCKDSKEYVPKIADVLAQLLLTEDNTELLVIHHSLVTLVKLDTKGEWCGTLEGQVEVHCTVYTCKVLCSLRELAVTPFGEANLLPFLAVFE